MPRQVFPEVYLIADTRIDEDGYMQALTTLGVPDWAPTGEPDSEQEGDTEMPSDAEELIEFAGKSCYMSFSLDLNKNLTKVGARTNREYLQQGIIGVDHGSVLEHASVTFFLKDVTRVMTHELVRHRVGTAFSQVSGRYVRTDVIGYYLPKAMKGTMAEAFFAKAFATMEGWIQTLEKAYQIDELKDFNLKKKLTSTFRRLIGNGQSNHIVFTANHRALRHIIPLRTHRSAEEEIRIVFATIAELLKERYPNLYADMHLEFFDGIEEITFRKGEE